MKNNYILIGVFLIFSLTLVSAGFNYDEYVLKWQFCNALNFTEIVCDEWWGALADFPSNETQQQQVDLTDYYNKTEIHAIIYHIIMQNYSFAINSTIDNSSLDLSSYYNLSQVDNMILALRDSLLNNTVTQQEFAFLKEDFYGDERSGDTNNLFLILKSYLYQINQPNQYGYRCLIKIDVRVGTIESIDNIEQADKLVKLGVDFGDHQRQILAGIKTERMDPGEIIGRQALFVVNLEPREMMGEVSEGMLFDIGYADDIVPVLAVPERPVPNGARAG